MGVYGQRPCWVTLCFSYKTLVFLVRSQRTLLHFYLRTSRSIAKHSARQLHRTLTVRTAVARTIQGSSVRHAYNTFAANGPPINWPAISFNSLDAPVSDRQPACTTVRSIPQQDICSTNLTHSCPGFQNGYSDEGSRRQPG